MCNTMVEDRGAKSGRKPGDFQGVAGVPTVWEGDCPIPVHTVGGLLLSIGPGPGHRTGRQDAASVRVARAGPLRRTSRRLTGRTRTLCREAAGYLFRALQSGSGLSSPSSPVPVPTLSDSCLPLQSESGGMIVSPPVND